MVVGMPARAVLGRGLEQAPPVEGRAGTKGSRLRPRTPARDLPHRRGTSAGVVPVGAVGGIGPPLQICRGGAARRHRRRCVRALAPPKSRRIDVLEGPAWPTTFGPRMAHMTDDPFFALPDDSTWNACIGPQGEELHYLDGYLEAASELAEAVIEKKMFARRDTLVLPILYNARHAVELILKYVTGQLFECGAILKNHPANHDIKGHFDLLVESDVGDEAIRHGLRALERFVVSLDRIDDDGQELRYHVNRDGEISLKGESLANIEVIRDSLKELSSIVEDLKYRTIAFVGERRNGSWTPRCSRTDLVAIAGMMPPLADWTSEAFTEAKEAVKTRFGLSNTQCSKAIDAIKANREMMGMLGGETDLPYLTDDEAVAVVDQWRKLHPRPAATEPRIVRGSEIKAADLIAHAKLRRECVEALNETIFREEAADLEALYYLGRDGYFPELFEGRAEQIRERLGEGTDLRELVGRLLDKTNLRDCVGRGARRAGRLALAQRIEGMVTEEESANAAADADGLARSAAGAASVTTARAGATARGGA